MASDDEGKPATEVMSADGESSEAPVGYSEEDINFGRLFKAATHTSKRLMKELVVFLMYRTHVAPVERWPDTLEDYCVQILSWSKAKLRCNFNAEERNLLSEPIASADFDVSLLTKIIHKVFSDVELPGPLLNAIRDIKNVRNRVCHQHHVLDYQKLTVNMEDLKSFYNNFITEGESFLSVNMDDLRQRFLKEVDEILYIPVEINASEYFERVASFREDLVGMFIMNGRNELMDFYSKLIILNPFTWLSDDKFPELTVEKIFTPLNMQAQGRSLNTENLLTTEIIDEEIQSSTGILPSVLVLSGIAGCGKTSVCRYLLHDWRTCEGGVSTLRSVDVLIFVDLKNVVCTSQVAYLTQTLMPNTCRDFEENLIGSLLREMSILYIMDGFDEAGSEGRQLLKDIFSSLGDSRVIVTTRPEFIPSVVEETQRRNQSCLTVNIEGFSSDGITIFTSRVFSSHEKDKEVCLRQQSEFLKFIKNMKSKLGTHLKLPLTLALLIMLWRADHTRVNNVSSATQLYFEIFQLCTNRMISRLQSNSMLHRLDLEDFAAEWLFILGREAQDMLENNDYVISDDRRRALAAPCVSRGIDSIQVLSSFLMCEREESTRGINFKFYFIHKSQMEYLSAMYMVDELLKNSQPAVEEPQKFKLFNMFNATEKPITFLSGVHIILPELSYQRKWSQKKWRNTLAFVIGHLCRKQPQETLFHKVVDFAMKQLSSLDMFYLWQYVIESNHHPYVVKKAGYLAEVEEWNLSPEELCDSSDPSSLLFCETSFSPGRIVIQIVDSLQHTVLVSENGTLEKANYCNLNPILTALTRKPEVQLSLHLQQQFYGWGEEETADDLLSTLLPSGNLVAFTGHVGMDGMIKLGSVKNGLKQAKIRVSDPQALKALSTKKLASCKPAVVMYLRLDIPFSTPPSSLVVLRSPPELLSVCFRDIGDNQVKWAAEVLARLTCVYQEVTLVSSSLSPSKGERFIFTLMRSVKIKKRLTIWSSKRMDEDTYRRLAALVTFQFQWWS